MSAEDKPRFARSSGWDWFYFYNELASTEFVRSFVCTALSVYDIFEVISDWIVLELYFILIHLCLFKTTLIYLLIILLVRPIFINLWQTKTQLYIKSVLKLQILANLMNCDIRIPLQAMLGTFEYGETKLSISKL